MLNKMQEKQTNEKMENFTKELDFFNQMIVLKLKKKKQYLKLKTQ